MLVMPAHASLDEKERVFSHRLQTSNRATLIWGGEGGRDFDNNNNDLEERFFRSRRTAHLLVHSVCVCVCVCVRVRVRVCGRPEQSRFDICVAARGCCVVLPLRLGK